MPDISMCTGIDEGLLVTTGVRRVCPMRDRCHRYTEEPSRLAQAYVRFPLAEDGTCSMFWDNALRTKDPDHE